MSYIKNLDNSLNELIKATEIVEKQLKSAYIGVIRKVGEELNDKESVSSLLSVLNDKYNPTHVTSWLGSIEYYANKAGGGFGDKTNEETVCITVSRFMSVGMEYKVSRAFLKKLVEELEK